MEVFQLPGAGVFFFSKFELMVERFVSKNVASNLSAQTQIIKLNNNRMVIIVYAN